MRYKYSPSTRGFYLESIHKSIPADAVSISESDYKNLCVDRPPDKVITFDTPTKKPKLVPQASLLTSGQLYELSVDSLKRKLNKDLESLEYMTSNGLIQARPKDQQNIEGLIKKLSEGGSNRFIMKDNSVSTVTREELESALESGLTGSKTSWDNYFDAFEALGA